MSTQIGLVVQAPVDGLTLVLTERKSACGGCQTTHACNTCLTTAKIKAKVQNPIGARPGDVVEIYLDNRALWQSALVLYVLPLVGLFLGAIVGGALELSWFASQSTAAVLGGIMGLGIGLVLAVAVGNSRYAKQHFIPSITKVISQSVLPIHQG